MGNLATVTEDREFFSSLILTPPFSRRKISKPAGAWHRMVTDFPWETTWSGSAEMKGGGSFSRRHQSRDVSIHCEEITAPQN
jgi:hypothetical protein